ncbi:MAG: hypothetical protein GEU74_12270 [Nitriliruptorales bacterium]|nr:hypothetical protein [Nitriliruptorales bacterium]
MTPRSGRRAAADSGSTALTAVLEIAALLVVSVAGVVAVADLAVTSAQARAAADASALAAVATSPLLAAPGGGGEAAAVAAARSTASRNGATLAATDLQRWPLRIHLEVTVTPRTPWLRRIVGPMTAGATAAVRPRAAGSH